MKPISKFRKVIETAQQVYNTGMCLIHLHVNKLKCPYNIG